MAPCVAVSPDGSVVVWVDGHRYILGESAAERAALYRQLAEGWRVTAASLLLVGLGQEGQAWGRLAEGAERMARRLEERGR